MKDRKCQRAAYEMLGTHANVMKQRADVAIRSVDLVPERGLFALVEVGGEHERLARARGSVDPRDRRGQTAREPTLETGTGD